MIEAGLEFGGELDLVMTAFATLPPPLRPTHFSHEESIGSPSDRIDDQKRLAAFVAKSKSGFFLLGPALTYSMRIAAGKPMVCDCFLDLEPDLAKQFLSHFEPTRPLFGFACAPEEREHRNRVTIRQGANSIQSWVGRDIEKYIPGFYWLTLLPEVLAVKHGVPLPAVEYVAREHIELSTGQHLFRFYDRPEDWKATSAVAALCASLPGVFNVEKLKPRLAAAKNFLELNTMLNAWK